MCQSYWSKVVAFWQCFYHVVWATKNREPIIEGRFENTVFEVITQKSADMECEVLAVNGMPDHIHVAVKMPPTIAIANWVKNIKGVSSHELNTILPAHAGRFRWQRGYGVLTFGAKNMDLVVNYIAHQKQHHANDDLYAYLEHVGD